MNWLVSTTTSRFSLIGTRRVWFAFLAICLTFPQVVLATAGSGITYHGRILKPDGTALESANVQFKVQIRTGGAENCIMFEELQSLNMRNTSGVFSVTINDGAGTRQDTSGYTIDQVFQNKGTFAFPTPTCQSGSGGTTMWSPNSADGRKIKVTFRDENMTTWEPLPDQMINFVPMAIEAKQVGGFTPFHLLRVDDAATSSNLTPLTLAQLTELQALLGGSSTQFVKTSPNGVVFPNRATDPATPASGQIWYDTTTNQLKYYNGTSAQALGASGGALPALASGQIWVGNGSAVATGVTPSGDATLSTSGALTLKATGTAGTYYKVTTDAQGRVTTGAATLAESDLPTLTTAGKVSGSAITSGTIAGSTGWNTTGAITTTGNITGANVSATAASLRSVRVFNAANTQSVNISVPAGLASDFNFVLPGMAGANGNVLTTDGAGNLSWTAASAGSVTNVTGAAPITITGTAAAPVVNVSAATVSAPGVVQLSASGGTTAGQVVQSTDARLSDSRAPGGTAAGDLTGTYPAPVVAKLRGSAVGASTPVTSQVLRFGASSWDPTYLSFSDLKTSLGTAQIPTTCTSSQVWSYSSISDTFSCLNISVTASQVSGLGTAAAKNIPATGDASTTEVVYGTDTRLSDSRAPSGAAAGDLAGTYPSPTLSLTGVGSGTYTKVTVDTKGRVTGATNPTTISGFGITDAVVVGGNTPAAALAVGTTNAQNLQLVTGGANRLAIDTTGKVGIGTTTPATLLDVSGTVKIANGAEACSIAADGGMIRYNSNALQFCNGTSWQTLGISGAGITTFNGSTQSSQSFGAVGTSGTAPAFTTNTGSGVHTLNIPLAATAGTTAGLLSKTDYDAFNTKQAAGSYMTALTGDVTAAGPGSAAATIAANAITTAKVNDKAVTYAKIQDVTNGKILGRSTAGAGAVEELSLGAGLSLAAGTLNTVNNGTVTSVTSTNSYLTVGGTAAAPTLTTNVGIVANTVAAGDDTRITGALQKSGGTMTGAINMGASDLTNAGNITLAASKNLQLGTYATDPSTAGWGTAEKGRTWFNTATNQIKFWDGAAVQVIGTGAGTVASVTGTSPIIITGTATAPAITIQAATSTQNGSLSAADWTTFNGKLGNSLANGSFWIGNAGGIATAVVPTGDVGLTNAGVFSVNKILGTTVSASPTLTGQVMRYNGTNYAPGFVAMTDLRSTVTGAAALPSSCAASQTLVYNSVGDIMTCASIAIASTQVSGLGTAAALNVGIGANNVVQLSASSKLPAVDGSALTGLSASNITTGTVPVANGGTGSASGSIAGTGALTFGAGGTNQNVTLTPSGTGFTVLNGSVGIGTSAPLAPLHVVSDASDSFLQLGPSISATNANAGIILRGKSGGTATGQAVISTTNSNSLTLMPANGKDVSFIKGDASATQLIVKDSGFVGIGTTAPQVKLDVSGASTGIVGASVMNTNGSTTGNAAFYLGNYGSGRGFIQFNQARGTSAAPTATQAFDMLGLIQAQGFGATVSRGGTYIVSEAEAAFTDTSAPSALEFQTTAPGATAPTERMRITGAGFVGIGTTTPQTSLDVNGAVVTKAPTTSGGSAIDFLGGNLQFTTNSCGAMTLNNLKNGGNFTLAVQGTSAATACSFTAYSGSGTTGPLTVKMPPDHMVPISGKQTLYTFMVMNDTVYVAWVPGY